MYIVKSQLASYYIIILKHAATSMQQLVVVFLQGATRCNTLQHAATRCNTLQHAATRCDTPVQQLIILLLQRWALVLCLNEFNTLQHAATRCNTLQHAATRCNTLQHTCTTAPYRTFVL